MKIAINARSRKPREAPKCEACKKAGLQIVGDSMRCQHCGHQQGAAPVAKLGPVLRESISNYEQPDAKPRIVPNEIGKSVVSLNPLQLENRTSSNYEQPNNFVPATVAQEIKKLPPVSKEESGNYRQPGYEMRATIPENTPKSLGPSLETHRYEQPGTEAPVKVEQPVSVPVFVAESRDNIQQPGAENPSPHHDVGIIAPHLNAMGIGGPPRNHIEPDYRIPK